MMERPIPPGFDPADPDQLARHCRIALEGHRSVGTQWLGSFVTEDRLFGVVVAEDEAQLRRYWEAVGVAGQDIKVHRIMREIDAAMAGSPT
jgi:hypothetical protein